MTLPSDGDDLFRVLVSGEVDVARSDVRARLQDDAELRERWEEHVRIVDRLEAAARLEAEVLAEATTTRGSTSPEVVDRMLKARRESRPRAQGVGNRPHSWVATLIAACCVVAGLLWHGQRSEPPEIPMGASVQLLQPVGTVTDHADFEWHYPLPPGGYYEVRIWDHARGTNSEPIATSGALAQPQWSPPPEERARWPKRIHWRVDVHDGTMTVATGSATATRR